MAEVTVHIETEINPTESEEKVKTCVTNILANSDITLRSEGKITVLSAQAKGQDSLAKLRTLMRNDRVRDASRKALFRSMRGNTINFCLNKQVAFSGHISFCEETSESPLGPLKITIETDYPQQLIEWIAEKSS